MKYARYNSETGEITGEYDIECDPDLQAREGEAMATVADDVNWRTHYVKPSTTKANQRDTTPCRPSRTTIPADGTTVLKLSQLRANTVVTVTGPDSGSLTAVNGATETITFATPGTYSIHAQAPLPALPKEITIHAVEPGA